MKWWGAGGMYKGKNSDSHLDLLLFLSQPGPCDEEVHEHHTEQWWCRVRYCQHLFN